MLRKQVQVFALLFFINKAEKSTQLKIKRTVLSFKNLRMQRALLFLLTQDNTGGGEMDG